MIEGTEFSYVTFRTILLIKNIQIQNQNVVKQKNSKMMSISPKRPKRYPEQILQQLKLILSSNQ